MAKPGEVENNLYNIINNGTVITGDIQSTGDVRFDGILKGNLSAKGKLVIGPSGSIVGEITSKCSDIMGRVEGKIKVDELLALKGTAVFAGDIVAAKIAIEPGAVFNGNCRMETASNLTNAERRKD